MTEKRARTPLSKVRIPYFEREFAPVKPVRSRVRFKTVDEVIFEVCDTSIVPSTYMNRLIYGSRVNRQQSGDVTHPLPNVAADVFEKVMRYCYFHTSRYCDSLLPNEVKEWDDNFTDLDPRQLCELASAAYYLDVKDLIELTCRAIAAIISGKTAEQIRKTFHIENDLAGTIDRVLPNSVRRRGREHSPKENNRNRDTNHNYSQQESHGDVQEENPSVQKSVAELTEWINSSSSKATKKKKKKRRKDKNPAKKVDEYHGNSSEVGDVETEHTASTEPQVRERCTEEEESLPGPQESTDSICDPHNDFMHKDDREISQESRPITSALRSLDEVGLGSDPDPDHDGASSSSDIAFVSENLVNRAAVEERRALIQRTVGLKASGNSEKHDHPMSSSELVKPGQDEVCHSTTSDADSVQWVLQNSSSQPHPERKEETSADSSSDLGESSESDRSTASRQKESYDVEDGEHVNGRASVVDGSSALKTEDRKSDLTAAARPLKEDIPMTDAPKVPVPLPTVRDQRTSEEPFIDCPENMDREVEAFQQRLSITEPLSSHHNTPQVRDSPSTVIKAEDKKTLPPVNAESQRTANGDIKEGDVITRAGSKPRTSSDRKGILVPQEGREQTRPDNGHSTIVKHSSIPKEILTELLRINSEKEENQKIAAAIDEETARLGAKREKVRDRLAVLNMEERQLRRKYNLSHQFP